jgi:Flp pilus assembly pilin Flp
MPNERHANAQKQDAPAQAQAAAGDQDGRSAFRYALIASGIGAAVAATVYSLSASGTTLYESVTNLF